MLIENNYPKKQGLLQRQQKLINIARHSAPGEMNRLGPQQRMIPNSYL